ncbi:vacuolar protein sorting-associated protein 35-like [Convolutriloba macropyga]|uniref:vacuolar protein sorting-associated protein 35-like n=1 Tax=Convolutriloba macropyga TaxID=536237 RepID=UPI003F527520
MATLNATQLKEQEMILDEAKANVATQAMEMKRCLDKSKLMDGLKHASIMLSELKTSVLAPKYYYELYTCIADEMRHLEQYLLDEYRKGRRVEDLYELVQYAGNILPRLYLLVTVGVVYIQTEEQQQESQQQQQSFVRDILRDMVEMCRGIQHPLRGLFLRNYLIQTTKNILPGNLPTMAQIAAANENLGLGMNGDDTSNSLSQMPGTSVHDSIDYILMNFTEMTKLWVRMQYQGHTKDRQMREQERRDLKQLVGANLYALSSLENLHVDMYKNKVLPIILAQVVNSRDALAQEYLMEVIIHVFPDEFHLATLQVYLEACSSLHEDVDLNSIITTLISRLTQMANEEQGGIGIPPELQLFSVFSEKIQQIIKTLPKTPIEKIIGMQASLLSLALNCYSDKPEYVNIVLETTANIFNNFQIEKLQARSKVAIELDKMLKLPVDHYNDLLLVADMTGFLPLLTFLDWEPRKDLCCYLIENALKHACLVSDVEKTNKVLELLQTLYKQQSDCPINEDLSGSGGGDATVSGGGYSTMSTSSLIEEIENDISLLAKFLHNFYADDPNLQHLMLQAAKEHLCVKVEDTSGPVRRQNTLPALIFIALQLALRFHSIREQDENWGKKCQKIVGGYCKQLVETIAADEKGELALRMYLQCALVVDKLPFDQHESLAYEFFSQALALYEDAVTESRAQLAAIQVLMSSLQQMTCFTEENHQPLRTQCTLAASKLFKKPDQARAVALSAHLYWDCTVVIDAAEGTTQILRESKRVADCLKRGVKTANQVVDSSTKTLILIEMLSHYVHYFAHPLATEISASVVNGLTEKINATLESDVSHADDKQRLKHCLDTVLKTLKEKTVKAVEENANDEALASKVAELTVI